MHIGVDIEQFVRDPYGSGIQRVLQYLAKEWPEDLAQADFVVPIGDVHGLLSPAQAAEILTIPFTPREPGSDLPSLVRERIEEIDPVRVKSGDLLSIYDRWLLPEVSYLPSVLERFSLFSRCMPASMIGYDTLPMSEPANYRFKPGASAWVSEYFRLLATTDSVACISAYARDSILGRLRRDPALPISVAHPGGDHLPVRGHQEPERITFTRLGTLEARKMPVEILRAFQEASDSREMTAALLFIGGPSASDAAINQAVAEATRTHPVRWVQGAADDEVYDLVNRSSAFLSIGVEGYGIPVLEALRLGTPVLFDGVQPAGELMAGRGARRVSAMEHEDIVSMFVDYSRGDALVEVASELTTDVPTWHDFARAVVQTASG